MAFNNLESREQKVSIGIVGVGKQGRFHIQNLWNMHPYEISYAYDCDYSKVVNCLSNVTLTNTLEELLSPKLCIDIVIVATPPIDHFNIAMSALESGKHVVIEKPTTLSFEQTQYLINVADQKNRFILTHFNRRWDSDFLAVKSILSSSILGTVHSLKSHISDCYDGSGIYQNRSSWKMQYPGGGILLDWAPHLLDQLFDIYPMKIPEKIHCHTLRPNNLVDEKLEEQFLIEVYYDDFLAQLESTWNAALSFPRWYVLGTAGAIRIDSSKTNIRSHRMLLRHWTPQGVVESESEIAEEAQKGFSELVCKCMENQETPEEEKQRMLWVAYAIELAKQASSCNSPQTWCLSA